MLYYLIKLPRSGGSTLANKFVRYENDIEVNDGVGEFVARPHDFRRMRPNEAPRVVINEDSIIEAITGERWKARAQPFVHAVSQAMTRSFIQQGYDCLIDDTHTKPESIEQILHIDPNAVPIWIFPKDKIVPGNDEWINHVTLCIARAMNTKQEDLIPVIHKHADNLENLAQSFDVYKIFRW